MGINGKTHGVRLSANPPKKTVTSSSGSDIPARRAASSSGAALLVSCFAGGTSKSFSLTGFEAVPAAAISTSTPALTPTGGRHWVLLHAWAVTSTRGRMTPTADSGTVIRPTSTTRPSQTSMGTSAKSNSRCSPSGKTVMGSGHPSGTIQVTVVGIENSSPGSSELMCHPGSTSTTAASCRTSPATTGCRSGTSSR